MKTDGSIVSVFKRQGVIDIPIKPKICIVSSCGGHLTEVRTLRAAYDDCEHFYVINKRAFVPADMEDKTYFIRHSERDLLFLVNLWEAWTILRKEKPQVILSTGAGACVPFAIIGHLLNIRSIFVETFNRVTEPSLSGRIMYYLADRLFYQWETLQQFYPKGKYCGPLV